MGLNLCSYLLKKGTDNFADCTKDDAKKAGEIQVRNFFPYHVEL